MKIHARDKLKHQKSFSSEFSISCTDNIKPEMKGSQHKEFTFPSQKNNINLLSNEQTEPSKMAQKDTDSANIDNLMNDSTELTRRLSGLPNKRKCPFNEVKSQGQHHVSLKRNIKAESKSLKK